ncbi:MAG: MCE family protein [Candidatus Omnitrophica bacterium]|nr:MCE family protein [Candidatus Omnitrophota bacterium]
MRKSRNETLVGMFVILGFILLTTVVFFVSGVYFFRSGYSLNVMYDFISILDKGAPVRLAGVRVGEVSRVDLIYDQNKERSRVKVKLFIEKGVEIKENYLFKIQGTHILSEPHIEVEPQPGNAPLVRDGHLMEGYDPVPVEALIERGHRIADNFNEIIERLRDALRDEETGRAMKDIVTHLAGVTGSLDKVLKGSEDDLTGAVKDLQASTESLRNILDTIEKGEGTAGKLLVKDELYQEIREFVAEIKAHPWKLMKRDDKDDKKGFLFF